MLKQSKKIEFLSIEKLYFFALFLYFHNSWKLVNSNDFFFVV